MPQITTTLSECLMLFQFLKANNLARSVFLTDRLTDLWLAIRCIPYLFVFVAFDTICQNYSISKKVLLLAHPVLPYYILLLVITKSWHCPKMSQLPAGTKQNIRKSIHRLSFVQNLFVTFQCFTYSCSSRPISHR